MLAPIPMQPAYRYGEATPWGGSQLRALFNRDIPDDRTGESLEVSAIEGLNSMDAKGRSLGELIARYGTRLVGTQHTGTFPLLLKFIAAKDKLSVQVHPDDSYAAENENKLGKTEAWIILDAQEDARIVYGVNENVTKEQLREASLQGAVVESLLRSVPVKKGDAFFIPAGTVHAIGGGIVLYEIQQSSDVTYRFYDWERTDAQGNKRQLHLDQALDVTDVDSRLEATVPHILSLEAGKGKRELLLACPFFVTERYTDCEDAVLMPDSRRFRMLTVIEKAHIKWDEGMLDLAPGDTVFLPADGYPLQITGQHLLISYPVKE